MQFQLISFGTAFTACGAAVFSGQSEATCPRASSFFLGHIYDPLFLCCLNTLQGLTALIPWLPQTKKKTSRACFPMCAFKLSWFLDLLVFK